MTLIHAEEMVNEFTCRQAFNVKPVKKHCNNGKHKGQHKHGHHGHCGSGNGSTGSTGSGSGSTGSGSGSSGSGSGSTGSGSGSTGGDGSGGVIGGL